MIIEFMKDGGTRKMNSKTSSNINYVNYVTSASELGYYTNSSVSNSISNVMMNNSIVINNTKIISK